MQIDNEEKLMKDLCRAAWKQDTADTRRKNGHEDPYNVCFTCSICNNDWLSRIQDILEELSVPLERFVEQEIKGDSLIKPFEMEVGRLRLKPRLKYESYPCIYPRSIIDGIKKV